MDRRPEPIRDAQIQEAVRQLTPDASLQRLDVLIEQRRSAEQARRAADDCWVRFADVLPAEGTNGEADDLRRQIGALEPWAQGPFWLGGDVVAGGDCRSDERWVLLDPELPDLSARRALVVGSGAGFDCFMLCWRRAHPVLGLEPGPAIRQARFLESAYRTGTELRQADWRSLDAQRDGPFDIVFCDRVLGAEPAPRELLARLRDLTADGGRIVLGELVLRSVERSEYVRLLPESAGGRWIFGRLALRWLIEGAGLEVERELVTLAGPQAPVPLDHSYLWLRATPR